MSLAGLKVYIENDINSAQEMCEDCKNQLEVGSLCYKLLTDFVNRINDTKGDKEDWLINEIYQKILFVSTFMPLISSNTPLIKVTELEEAKEKMNNNQDIDKSADLIRRNTSKDRIESSRVSKRNIKSTPRSNYLIKP